MRHGGKVSLTQNVTAVEFFRESLQDNTVSFVAVVYLPEPVRAAPIALFIVMMKGPDTIPRCVQNGTREDPECEPQDKIEVMVADLYHVAFGERVEVSSPAHRSTLHYRHSQEVRRCVDCSPGWDTSIQTEALVKQP